MRSKTYAHHFGYSLIYGKGSKQAKGYPNESIKLIVKDQKIWKKITEMYNSWTELKYEDGHGTHRYKNFESKDQIFREMLLDSTVIHKQNPEELLKKSGIKEWKGGSPTSEKSNGKNPNRHRSRRG